MAAAGGGGADEALNGVPALQALKTHVTVAVRVRGLDTGYSGGRDDLPAIFPNEADSGHSLVIDGPSRGATAFNFDYVFWSLAESKRCVGSRAEGGSERTCRSTQCCSLSISRSRPIAWIRNILRYTHSKYPAYVEPLPEASQETIYSELGAPVVQNTLAGFNCSVFAYGQVRFVEAEKRGQRAPS